MGTDGREPGLMRNLGRFFGEVGRAIRSPVKGSSSRRRAERSSETRYTADGRVTLTRTTIEEIRVEPAEKDSNGGACAP